MRRLFFILITLCTMALCVSAQQKQGQGQRPKFSPEKFQKELEDFIKKEACLSNKEANAFFPVFREMGKKQRGIYHRMRKLGHEKPKSDEECLNVIKQRDKMDLELKKLQQSYHNKFLEILSPGKVFDVIRAEDKFHRRMLNKWRRNEGPKRD